ncbi:MAG TPA: DUF4013 domain-containing protein, partial [Pirellulaceae bacterium]|nr:DUF4013 domain-containing protein [Pirellulaceae bacterium]
QALAYIGAIQFVPIIGYLIIRGWRFEIAKRIGENHADSLPDWRHAGVHLQQGTLLFAVTQLYFLPMYIALAWPRSGVLWAILRLLHNVYLQLFTVIEPRPWWEIIGPGLKSLAILFAILLLVPPLISPLVESATQRYAQTGRVRALFEVWTNLRLAFSDLGDVVRIEGYILLLNIGVLAVSLLLTLTVGGAAFIPPVMIPIYMWTRGALMGQWIRKNHVEELVSQRLAPA